MSTDHARLTEEVERPIPMILHCPACGMQHIDQPTKTWPNPPHRSHLCAGCGSIWRPADVFTTGVATIETAGKADRLVSATLTARAEAAEAEAERLKEELKGARTAVPHLLDCARECERHIAARKAAEAREREAVRALEPFGELANHLMAEVPDSYPSFVSGLTSDISVSAREIRHAASIVKGEKS